MVLIRILILCLLIVGNISLSFASEIRLEQTGINALDADEIEKLLGSTTVENAEAAADRILNYYAIKGYYSARIDTLMLLQREDTTLIRLVINEGPLYTTGESKITGETEFVPVKIPDRIGEPINIKLVRLDAKDVISILADEGHPHSVVEVIPVIKNSGDGAQVDFEFNVITGEAVILDTVIFRVKKTNHPHFLMI